ncbi:response regulator [Ascidiaceihabitans sp.]|uniref:response regulator n=1 Tax=Ascidiaceihabitans sp. TaxID=1872644 RepID=UPI00329A67C8
MDLVVSDLVMPGTLNGNDLAAKIAQEFSDLKVLLASGYASDVITSSMEHDGPLDILHKPYRQSDLAQRLHAMLADTAAGTAMSDHIGKWSDATRAKGLWSTPASRSETP